MEVPDRNVCDDYVFESYIIWFIRNKYRKWKDKKEIEKSINKFVKEVNEW